MSRFDCGGGVAQAQNQGVCQSDGSDHLVTMFHQQAFRFRFPVGVESSQEDSLPFDWRLSVHLQLHNYQPSRVLSISRSSSYFMVSSKAMPWSSWPWQNLPSLSKELSRTCHQVSIRSGSGRFAVSAERLPTAILALDAAAVVWCDSELFFLFMPPL